MMSATPAQPDTGRYNHAAISAATAAAESGDWQQQLGRLLQHSVAPEQRLHWMMALRQHLPVVRNGLSDGNKTLMLMIELAGRLCDWPLVVQLRLVFERQLKQGNAVPAQQVIDNIVALAAAYRQQGLLIEAAQCIENALLLDYRHPALLRCHRQIEQEIHELPFNLATQAPTPVMLMPLRQWHLEDFRWAYADPAIAQLCNLPDFKHDEQWLDWLHDYQSQPGQYLFAVNHPDWGFIGSVCLEVFDGIGFFYYWLDRDFQGHGFGPQAVRKMLQLGVDHLGLSCCYAKVYRHNPVSQKAMDKLGFLLLPVTLEPPYDNEILYYLGPDKEPCVIYRELEWLLTNQNSDVRLSSALPWRIYWV